MSDNLKILLSAGLDSGKAIKEINNDLKALSKHPALQSLHVEINIKDNFSTTAYRLLDVIHKINQAVEKGTSELGNQMKAVQSLKSSMVEMQSVENKAKSPSKAEQTATSEKSLGEGMSKDLDTGFRNIAYNEKIINLLSESVAEAGLNFKGLTWYSEIYTRSAISAQVATLGLQTAMSMGLSLAITGITWVISKLAGAFAKSRKEAAEAVKISYEQINSLREQKQTISELRAEMENLQRADRTDELNIEGRERLLEIQTQLAEQYGVAATKMDSEGRAYTDSIAFIDARTEALERQIRAEEEANRNKLSAKDSKNTEKIKKAQKDIENYEAQINLFKDQIAIAEANLASGSFPEGSVTYNFWEGILESYHQEQAVFEGKLMKSKTSLEANLKERTDSLEATSRNYINILTEQGIQISDTQRLFISQIVDSIAGNGSSLFEQENQVEEIVKNLASSDFEDIIASYHDLVEQFEQNPTSIDNTKIAAIRAEVEKLLSSVTNGVPISEDFMKDILAQFPNVEAKAFNLNNALEQINSSYNKSSQKLSVYNELLKDNSSEKGINAERVAELIQEDQSLVDLLYIENGIIKLNTELTEKQREQELQSIKAITLAKKDELIASHQNLAQKLSIYGIELATLNTLKDAVEAKEKLQIIDVDNTGVESARFFAVNKHLQENKEFMDALIDIFQQSELLEKSLEENGKNLEENLGGAAGTITEQLTKLQKQLAAVDEALTRSASRRERFAKSSQKYRDSLHEENQLLEQKKKLIEQQAEEDSLAASKTDNVSTAVSSVSGNQVQNMLDAAKELQGEFNYLQIPGEFKGTYDEFVAKALSDCSQFVQEMYKEFLDIKLPRTSSEQAKVGLSVNQKDIQPGDLVFFNDGSDKKKVSHVGISLGGTKFIQMGDKEGLKEADLTSTYWSPRYHSAKRIVGEVSPNETGKSSRSTEWYEADDRIYQNYLSEIESNNAFYQNELSRQDGLLKKSQAVQGKYSEDSDNFRDEDIKQTDILLKKRELLHAQADKIRDSMKRYHIESDELNAQIRTLGETYDDLTLEIQEKRAGVINSRLNEFKNKLSEVGDQLQLSKAKMAQFTEGSVDYTNELRNQIALNKEQIAINNDAVVFLEEQLENEQLSVKVKKELREELEQLLLDNYEYVSSIRDINEDYADAIIANYKKMIEKKRDLELDAIEKSKELENEQHEERLKHFDEELKRFEEVINSQLELLDRQNVSDDYDKALNKKLEERQEIVDQINVLALDDSYEAKAKRKTLEEQLDEKNEAISEFRLNRERELRKQNLADQLEEKKEQISAQKELENDHHAELIEDWEEEKEKKEQLYQAMLEDEEMFYQLKQDLLSNDAILVQTRISEIKGTYGEFFVFLQDQMAKVGTDAEILGANLLKNLNYLFKQDEELLNQNPNFNPDPQPNANSGSGSQTNDSGKVKDTPAARAAWQRYLNNKQQAENIKKQMAQLSKNSTEYKNLEKSFTFLKSQNEAYRSEYGFLDKSYDELRNLDPFSAESGGMTPSFSKGKFLLAHEKELVLNKSDTENLLTAVDITRGLVSGIKGIASTLFRPSSADLATPNGDVNMYITIEKLQGNEEGAHSFFNLIQKNLKKSGI